MIAQPATARNRKTEVPASINIPSARLNREMAWFLEPKQEQKLEIPVEIATAMAATIWILEVDSFREKEEIRMVRGEYQSSLAEHRVALTTIIANGEKVVYAAKKHGMVDTPAGFKVADLESTLALLHATFLSEHGPTNPPETDKAITALFAQFDEQKS